MKYPLIGLVALLLTACSPKYVVKTVYIQPSTKQEKVCVQECNVKRQTCQIHCNQKRDNCLVEAEKKAKESFPSMLDEYDYIMHQYEREQNRYEVEIASWDRNHHHLEEKFQTYRRLCDNKKDRKSYECRRAREIDSELESIEAIEPTAPPHPHEPILAEEIKKAQSSCSNNCGCQDDYDNCFVSCGGTLDYKKICVENCN